MVKPLSKRLADLAVALVLVASLSWAVGLFAAVETTTVSGKVILPGGNVATAGTITATLAAPGSVDDLVTGEGERVGGLYKGTIAGTGDIANLQLVPNDVIVPDGTYYLVTFSVTSPVRTAWSEKWAVTSDPDPIDVGDIARLDVAPGLSIPQATSASRPPGWHRATQAGTITGRYYLAGMATAANLQTLSLPPDTMRAVPFLQGKTRSVDSLAFSVGVGGNVGAQGRACLYANSSEANPYPAALVSGASCQMGISTTGVKACAITASLTGDTLYWAAFFHADGVGSPSFGSVTSTLATSLLGVSSVFVPDGVAVSVASTYGVCPDPFPAGASPVAEGVAVGVRYLN